MKTLLFTLVLLISSTSFARGGGPGNGDSGFKAAMDACASELGISKPEKGSRPSQEEMSAMDSCMSGKGYERPSGPPPQGGRGQNQQDDQE